MNENPAKRSDDPGAVINTGLSPESRQWLITILVIVTLIAFLNALILPAMTAGID